MLVVNLRRGALVDLQVGIGLTTFAPQYSVILSPAPTALACRGLELDQLAEASWVRRQAPRLDPVADRRQRRHGCGLPR